MLFGVSGSDEGAAFRAMREYMGLSAAELARILNVSEKSVRRWETDYEWHPAEFAMQTLEDMYAGFDADAREMVVYWIEKRDEVDEGAGVSAFRATVKLYRNQRAVDAEQRGVPVGYANSLAREVAQRLDRLGFIVQWQWSD